MHKNSYVQKLLRQFFEDRENRIALSVYDGTQIVNTTYCELAKEILGVAALLRIRGMVGRHIALLGANSKEWLVYCFAIAVSGNVVVPINPGLPREQILAQCELADVFAICGDGADISSFQDELLCLEFTKPSADETLTLEEIAPVESSDLTMLLFTSGTTGESKAVEITYGNMESSLRSEDGVFQEQGINRIMSVLPMFHIAGVRGTFAMLHRYKTVCIGRGAMYLFRDMPKLLPNYILLVPMMVDSLVKIVRRTSEEELENFLGRNLKRICVGGATVNPDDCRYLMAKGFEIDCGYALSETTGVGTWGKWDDNHLNTVGKLSNELECRVEDGELLLKGPAVMKGYYKDPEATARALENEWFHTGDLGFFDEDGYGYLTGRKKNLIVMSNGEKINPEELEYYFQKASCVRECVVSYCDGVLGADVWTDDPKAVAQLLEDYNMKMPLSHRIHRITYRDEPMRRTASGKIMREEKGL